MNNEQQNTAEIVEAKNQSAGKENAKTDFSLPTLDQFMEIISGENNMLAATPSGYNVYNKYNKTS